MRPRALRVVLSLHLSSSVGFGFGFGVGGCAAVLGFEDTTLRSDTEGGVGPNADGGLDATGDGAAARLTVQPTEVVLRRGTSADVTVTIARGGDVQGPVAVTVTDLPAGVTAAPATIRDRESATKVTFTAAADAPFATSKAQLSVDKGGLAPIPLSVLVAGASGTPDTTFDGDGFVTDSAKGNNATFYALAVQADGQILAGGAGAATSPGWLVRRYDSEGNADAAFATALTGLPTDGEVRAIAVDPTTSKILLAGASSGGVLGPAQLTVLRREASGAPDATFAGGAFRFSLGDAPVGSTAFALAMQADGGVVVVGTRREPGGKTSGVAIRLRKDGSRDPTWSGGNVVAMPDNDFVGVANGPAGSVFIAGTDSSAQLGSFYLTKRLASGLPDGSFGSGGATTFGLGFRAHGFVRMPDGSLVVAGESAQAGNVYTLGRTDAAGGQVFARGIATATGASFNAVTADATGRIVAAGNSTGNPEARIARVHLDGTVDAKFGDAGSALVTATTLSAAAVQADGRILVAGNRAQAGGIVYRIWP